ncbi:transposase family protein [Streptomyces sp. TX20-6-3]|uniref:transposase family protein n=1 Tax=Streptomyces sp. TX20-6-3 TaxID=3028705 RepID=UPI0029B8113D|nr:transposase family protein [Streptomyces sp. TX20-6-3]MDX2565205.1 transposase family protein [Streptomyces sp. TX20-6-3]
MQVIIDADTKLVIAAARPVPGNTADARAWRDSGLAQHYDGVTVPADGATTPASSSRTANAPAGPSCQAKRRTTHRKVRARVEHAFARMKHYKILRDCQQRGNGLHHAVQAVAHMHNLTLTS